MVARKCAQLDPASGAADTATHPVPQRPIFDVYSDKRVKVATVKIMAMNFWQIRQLFYSEMDAPSGAFGIQRRDPRS